LISDTHNAWYSESLTGRLLRLVAKDDQIVQSMQSVLAINDNEQG